MKASDIIDRIKTKISVYADTEFPELCYVYIHGCSTNSIDDCEMYDIEREIENYLYAMGIDVNMSFADDACLNSMRITLTAK